MLFLAPRLGRPEVLTGYVEGEPLYLAAPVSGTITQMSVVRGQRVAAGARLFVVDPQQTVSVRDQAAAQVTAAQAQAVDARKGQRPVELAHVLAGVEYFAQARCVVDDFARPRASDSSRGRGLGRQVQARHESTIRA